MADTPTTVWANPACRKLTPSVSALPALRAMCQLRHLMFIKRLFDDSPHIHVVRNVTWYAVVRFPSALPQGQLALAGSPPEQERTP